MEDFKTPVSNRIRSRLENTSAEYQTPVKIPATPYMKQIGYGCGVNVFTLERSPKIGFIRSPWAIKKRNTQLVKDKKYDERIQMESDILKKLNHPNIVGFRAFTLSEKGEPCLAMEQLEKCLGDLIEIRLETIAEPFPAKDIEHVGYEIAKGLEYLHHTVHILHGDLKSYNVLVSDKFKVVKLCDFGVSIPLTDTLMLDTSKHDVDYIGTKCWNAPEVISEEGPITNKTDMWAYGLILWEMIALCPPHANPEESFDSTLDDSMSGNHMSADKYDESNGSLLSDSMELLNCKFGTRPALPAIAISPDYDHLLEVFFLCTDQDYKTRPSAKGVVMYFTNLQNTRNKQQ